MVAFQSAGKALACAVASQQALTEGGTDAPHPQPLSHGGRGQLKPITPSPPHPLKIRMALHTGDMEFQEGDYRGLALHRASRMLVAAQGGQILLSDATAGLIRRDLPEEIRLIDLGVYRLRDVPTPERLYQVEYPDMIESPSLRFRRKPVTAPICPCRSRASSDANRRSPAFENCYRTPSHPITRSPAHLITLSGPGGTGKTRLALETAERLSERYRGAVWFVGLGDLGPSLIAGAILDVLRVPRSPREPIEQVGEALSTSRPCWCWIITSIWWTRALPWCRCSSAVSPRSRCW